MREATVARMDTRVRELIGGFETYVARFNSEQLFTGPSLYFHARTLELLREHDGPASAVMQRPFAESLYATLTSWGMHRMGRAGAKLVDFDSFRNALQAEGDDLRSLQTLALCDLSESAAIDVSPRLWSLIMRLRVSATETQIVAGSKTLHHLLPALVPPIDREYTLRFFFHNKNSGANEAGFTEVFRRFHRIALESRPSLAALLGRGMNTSPSKIIDNAIVGYVRTHLGKPESEGATE